MSPHARHFEPAARSPFQGSWGVAPAARPSRFHGPCLQGQHADHAENGALARRTKI